jgi:hypothetical protein
MEAVQAWLSAAGISNGPVFRAVSKGGRVSDGPLVDDSAARIVKRSAARPGLDPAHYTACAAGSSPARPNPASRS